MNDQQTTVEYDRGFLKELMVKMMTVRKFEEKLQWLFAQGLIYGTMHPGIGEEATGVGTTAALRKEDYMLATHRGHGQVLGKGVDINLMMAEILARDTGTNRGKGGSMHIADVDNGILGANGIVAANTPLVCGAALTIKLKKIPDRVAVAFFGDGGSNEGAVHESMNLASAWNLPVIFVLVNNTYGMSTPLRKVVKDTDLSKRAIPFDMKAYDIDGNDVLEVYRTVSEARKYVVEGNGPVLIVEHTYRTSGHSKSDGNLYRTKEEIAEWKAKNPVIRFTDYLISNGIFDQSDIDEMDREAADAIEKAVEYAKASPMPLPDGIEDSVYAE